MTVITIIDRPCGFGKSTGLIADLKANINNLNYLLVVPELSEIKRFLDDVGSDLKTPLVEENRIKGGEANNKTDVLIDLLSQGENVVITHALYERIRKFERHLHKYHVIIDEVPTVAKQVPTTFGTATFKHHLDNKGYIQIDPKTKLITPTNKWLINEDEYTEGSDKDIQKFMATISNADVFYVSGTYCVMPLPDAFFTKPKSLTILTFMFTGTQLHHYMNMRDYKYSIENCPNELARFKWEMNKNLLVYNNTASTKTGYTAMISKPSKSRKKVGNFIKNALQRLRKKGICIDVDKILVASHKDAWFGVDENSVSAVSNSTRLKSLSKIGQATYTAMTTRGTNKFKKLYVLVLMGKLNINPNLAEFLGMRTKQTKDAYVLSELIQLIYRTAIRNKEETLLFSADKENIRLLKEFLNT